MGQTPVADPSCQLIAKKVLVNTKQSQYYTSLRVYPSIHVPFNKILCVTKTQTNQQFIAHYFNSKYVYMKFTCKQLPQKLNDGVFFMAAGTFIYGYKYKAKSSQKIRRQALLNRSLKIGEFVLFKKRIYAQPQQAVRIFSQLKLLSLCQIGPYIGKMPDGSDGYINNQYIQYFGEIVANIRNKSEKTNQKLIEQIEKQNFTIDKNNDLQIGFSPNQKKQMIKLYEFNKSFDQSSLVSINTALVKKQYEEQAQKMIIKLDKHSNQLSSLQNLVIQKNIDQAIDIFEQVMQKIDNNPEKYKYAYDFCQILSQNKYFAQYQQQVITQTLSTGQILKQSNVISTPYTDKLQQMLTKIKIKSNNFSSENQLEQFSKSFSRSKQETSRTSLQSLKQLKMQQLKINVQGNNKNRVQQIVKEIKKMEGHQQYENNRFYEVQFQYGVILMKTGKSRFALVVFEIINRSEYVPLSLKIKVYNYMGIIYYYKQNYRSSVRQFQNTLTVLYKGHIHSTAMMIAWNNIACSYYKQNQFSKAVSFFCRALNCGQSSSDYEMMARSNKGMALIEKNMLKEARHQFMIILKMIEPVNNASIICKAYANLGYLNMIQNNFNEALTDFQISNRIQAVCLIPNGHKASLFLHNNMAMVYYKKKEYRKALAHIQKCKDQIETLKGLDAVTVNFNYAMTYQKLYFHEFALKHLADSRKFLQRLGQKQRYLYQKKIEIEIQKLNSIRIIQDSQQSGHPSLSSMYSTKKYL